MNALFHYSRESRVNITKKINPTYGSKAKRDVNANPQ